MASNYTHNKASNSSWIFRCIGSSLRLRRPCGEKKSGSYQSYDVGRRKQSRSSQAICIPRVDLNGALLLARFFAIFFNCLKDNIINIYAWTGSQVVLSWLSSPPRNWKPFVTNRTSEIMDIIPCKKWRYVPLKENPADLGSRGMSPKDLSDCSLWWEEPQWLTTEEACPNQPTVNYKRFMQHCNDGKNKKRSRGIMKPLTTREIIVASNMEIKWHTISPLSPHVGGLWEAGVKSVKFHLKRVVGSTNLSFEEFYTLLTPIEAVLSSRPLVRLADNDIDSLNVLTPSHFLVGEEIKGSPETVEESKLTLNGRWDII
ncbi:DUF5641 domain-containing protein [Trichonephila clavipes]|nr:DUF5641 domain-containing protein [Trichonephila clavipes]